MEITSKEKMEICNNCERLSKARFCKICGCFMPIKTRVPFLRCPLNKW